MNNEGIERKNYPLNANSKTGKKANLIKFRNISNNNVQADSSLILKEYSTPNIMKNEKSLLEMEMRKTLVSKQMNQNSNNKSSYNFDNNNKHGPKRYSIYFSK